MKFQAVVIDTNFLMRDYLLSGNALRKVVKTKSFYVLEICIPEVVRDECIGNFTKEVGAAGKELASLSDKLDKLGLYRALSRGTVAKQLDSASRKYVRGLDEFIASNGVTLLPYLSITHKNVVERMYQNKKPFTDG